MASPPPLRVYAYPCGCVERDAKGSGRLEADCGNPACYRRTRRADLVVLNRSQRRRLR